MTRIGRALSATGAPNRSRQGGWRFAFPLSFAALIGLWWFATTVLTVPNYVLPTVDDTARALYIGTIDRAFERGGLLLPLLASLKAAALGFVFGAGAGFLLAAAMAESEPVRRVVMPYVVALQSLPKVALAPLMVIWFGFGLESKVVLASLVCFFPMLIASFTGFSSANRDQIKLFRSMRASRFQIFRYLKLPNAAPMVFAGLDMAVVYALIGTIVAEFVGGQEGIGISIIQMRFVNDTASVFAALVLLAVTGILLHAAVRLVETRAIYWTEMEGGLRLT